MQFKRVWCCLVPTLLFGASVTFTSVSVSAADLALPRDGYDYDNFRPQSAVHRYFYVRGDVGIGRHSAANFVQKDLSENGGTFLQHSVDDAVTIGAGIGVQLSTRFRLDLTGEYRSTAPVKAIDNLTIELVDPDGKLQANTLYDGCISSTVGLLNGYWDLFNLRGFTPYVGAGVGVARHTMSGFTTASSATFTEAATGLQTTQVSNGTSPSHSQSGVVWALMAGTSYDLGPSAKLDLGYRYINLGSGISATTGFLDCVCGTVGAPLKVSDLDAHEFRVGVRWALGASPAASGHPLK